MGITFGDLVLQGRTWFFISTPLQSPAGRLVKIQSPAMGLTEQS